MFHLFHKTFSPQRPRLPTIQYKVFSIINSLKMYQCSACRLACIYRLRFIDGCDHVLCSDCTMKHLWKKDGETSHFFICCHCCHETYCPLCFVQAARAVTDTWDPMTALEEVTPGTDV